MKNFCTLLFFLTVHHFLFAQDNLYEEAVKSGYGGGTITDLRRLKNSINFCVIGDWGRHGMYFQKEVAEKLGDASIGLGADFIISTGDNFYPKGVKSTADPSWGSSFENIYTHHGTYVDWYAALGNHDYSGNPEAQIEYGKISQRWNMPSRYFTVKKNIDQASSVEFFFLDTSPFQKDYYRDEKYKEKVAATDTLAQKKWLKEALQTSTATWKFVVGHHPLYSAGMRKGKTGDMRTFKSLLNKYHVDSYFAGHEHHLEYDETNSDVFHHFISGSGSEVRPVTTAPYAKAVFSAHGFIAVSVAEKEMLAQFIDHTGKVIYSTAIKK